MAQIVFLILSVTLLPRAAHALGVLQCEGYFECTSFAFIIGFPIWAGIAFAVTGLVTWIYRRRHPDKGFYKKAIFIFVLVLISIPAVQVPIGNFVERRKSELRTKESLSRVDYQLYSSRYMTDTMKPRRILAFTVSGTDSVLVNQSFDSSQGLVITYQSRAVLFDPQTCTINLLNFNSGFFGTDRCQTSISPKGITIHISPTGHDYLVITGNSFFQIRVLYPNFFPIEEIWKMVDSLEQKQ